MNKMKFSPFPNLSSERLNLRQVVLADENEILVLRSDGRVMKFLDRPMAKSINDSRQFIHNINDGINKNEAITWAITLKNDSKLIGTIGYWQIFKEHFRAEIGFILHPDFQGKGIMQEAINKIIEYGFDVMKLHSIEANVNPENVSSIKLLERNNFIKEGYFKENYYYNGKFLDSAIYSLLNNKKERYCERYPH